MRFLLVDRITEWKDENLIKGIKNIAMSEDYLEFHFPQYPVMPGVLLLEALAQLAGWYEAVSSGFRNWILIGKVAQCRFYGFTFPGDQVELEVKDLSPRDSISRVYGGTGKVDGKKKIVARFEGELIPLEKIEDIHMQKDFFDILTRDSKGSRNVRT